MMPLARKLNTKMVSRGMVEDLCVV